MSDPPTPNLTTSASLLLLPLLLLLLKMPLQSFPFHPSPDSASSPFNPITDQSALLLWGRHSLNAVRTDFTNVIPSSKHEIQFKNVKNYTQPAVRPPPVPGQAAIKYGGRQTPAHQTPCLAGKWICRYNYTLRTTTGITCVTLIVRECVCMCV